MLIIISIDINIISINLCFFVFFVKVNNFDLKELLVWIMLISFFSIRMNIMILIVFIVFLIMLFVICFGLVGCCFNFL